MLLESLWRSISSQCNGSLLMPNLKDRNYFAQLVVYLSRKRTIKASSSIKPSHVKSTESNPSRLIHRQYSSEPYIARHHMIQSFLRFSKWKLLNHNLNILMLSKINSLLRVQGMTRRPSVNRDTLHDHLDGIEWDFSHSC